MENLPWRKSTFSDNQGTCVEVAPDGDVTRLRDTKDDGAGPVLTFTRGEMRAFVLGVKAGEFDDLT